MGTLNMGELSKVCEKVTKPLGSIIGQYLLGQFFFKHMNFNPIAD